MFAKIFGKIIRHITNNHFSPVPFSRIRFTDLWLRRMKKRKKEREKKKEKLRKGGRQGDYKYLIAGCLKRLDPRKDNIRLFARFG